MTRNLRNQIKKFCNNEIKFISAKNNYISVKLPYRNEIIDFEIEGHTDDELLDSFKDIINRELEEMINHLEDCKL